MTIEFIGDPTQCRDRDVTAGHQPFDCAPREAAVEFSRIRGWLPQTFVVAMPTLTLYGLGRRGAVQFAPQSSCAEIVQEWCRIWAVSSDEGRGLAIMCAEFISDIFG